MDVWRVAAIIGGSIVVLLGLLKKEFTPLGLSTMFVWGDHKDARIPRWIAAPFYILVGLFLIYFGVKG
jgi:hypothetical protein